MKKYILEKIKPIFSFCRKHFNKKSQYLILTIFSIVASAFLSVFYITLWQFGDFNTAMQFIFEKQPIIIFSSIVMFWVIIFMIGIIGNWTWSIGITYASITVVMFINSEKMRSRNTPFLPEDLMMASETGTLGKLVNWGNLLLTLLLVIAILVATFYLNKKIKKNIRYNFPKKYLYLLRILLVLASVTVLVSHTDYIRNKTDDNYAKIDFLETEVNSYNQEENYRLNGFIIGTIFNLQPKKMKEPESYSKQEIQKIVEKWKKRAEESNKNRKDIKDEKVNIVYVMSESFIDPTLAKHLYDYGNTDPIPYTHKLTKEYTSGWAASSEYGGGTANVEFEALTGLSNYFLNVIPYSSMISKNPETPSIAKYLKNRGYQTLALHPFEATMYKRDTVYPNLGFDNFKSIKDFKYTDKIDNSQYVSDASSFNQVVEELKNNNSPQFIHLVTMQNHMPYDAGVFNENPFPVKNINGQDADAEKFQTYLTGINKSDTAMKDFIKRINELDKKTIVVFWGDHWPGIFGELFGKQKQDHDIRRTPLFIYKNFESEKQDLKTTSLNYLQVKVLDEIGAKLTPYQQMLLELSKEYNALTKDFVQGEQNSQTLKEYQMIEYDILSGKKWSLGDFYK